MKRGDVVDVNGDADFWRAVGVDVTGEEGEENRVGAFEELRGCGGQDVSADDIPASQKLVAACLKSGR